jgi:hypothetical protein
VLVSNCKDGEAYCGVDILELEIPKQNRGAWRTLYSIQDCLIYVERIRRVQLS